jgi:HAMP domain-containing protein
MSYLRGPLTKPQVQKLMAGKPGQTGSPVTPVQIQTQQPAVRPASEPTPAIPSGFSAHPPTLGPDVSQVFLPLDVSEPAAIRQLSQETGQSLEVEQTQLIYEPAIIGAAEVRFVDRRRKIDEKVEKMLLAYVSDELGGIDWGDAEAVPLRLNELTNKAERVEAGQGPFFAPVPETANSARELKGINQDLADWLYYNSRQVITVHPELGLFQHPTETKRAFKIRLQQAARENRDAEVDKLEKKYDTRIARLESKLRKQKRALDADQEDYQARKREEMIGLGESVLGFFIGRRSTRTLSKAATRRRMTSRAKLEIEETQDEITELQEEITELEGELKEMADEITRKWADLLDDLSTEELAPRRTDINVRLVTLAWLPSWLISYTDGRRGQTATIAAYPLPKEA